MSNYLTNQKRKVFSTLAQDSPVDLNWLKRPKDLIGTEDNSLSKGDKAIISEAFWDDFLIVAKMVYLRDKEADLFDVFNTIREEFLGGWTMLQDSKFIKDIDDQVEREYQKELKRGKA